MRIYAARSEDVQQGVVWARRLGMPPRCVLRISNPANGKAIHCEAMSIDENFLRDYNQAPRFSIDPQGDALVVSGWHRALLGGIKTGADVDLTIDERNGSWGKLCACLDHPQTVVRVGAWLGAIGLGLGVVGFALSLWSIWLTYNPPAPAKIATVTTASSEARAPKELRALTADEAGRILLYAELRGGKLVGKFFNQNGELVVTEIVVEAVPDDEKNIFNKFAPRLFAAQALAGPHTMSQPFEVETGALNPETHKLRVAGGRGHSRT